MAKVPQKVIERLIRTTGKFQHILKAAKDRDINESDTVLIIGDMLEEVFGFNKYLEITSEYTIRGTYCDLAIKTNGKVQYLLEVKAIGIDLKESHVRQVVDYGSKQGIQWVVLTNGILWKIYRIRFEKPIKCDLVCSFNFLELNPKKADDQEKLFLLCKKGVSASVREDFHERTKNVNRFVIGVIILSDNVVNMIKRELRKLSSGLKIESSEIERILQNDVMKREVLEGEEASKAKSRISRIFKKPSKKTEIQKSPETEPSSEQLPDESSNLKDIETEENLEQ